MSTYRRLPITLVRGEGVWLFDAQGKRYLDFVGGIAVNTLGHAHPALAEALCEQARRLIHCSNLFRIPEQERLAARLSELSALDEVFFCNSGAEANEGAFKLARKYWYDQGENRRTILCAFGSFHGRTLATLTATGQDKVKRGFEPLPPGFRHVPYGDLDALSKALAPNVAAVCLEPIQGEGGVRMPPNGYLKAVRELCDEHGILLILDEVQTGVGRTGDWFAFQKEGITPDILTLAKGLAGGVPIGAVLARKDVAAAFTPGSHGSTFGGNPLACRAALTVLDVIEADRLLNRIETVSKRLMQGLETIRASTPHVKDIRGRGLMIGIECNRSVAPIIDACAEKGLLLLSAGEHVLRLLPPLILTLEEAEEALAILAHVLKDQHP